MFWCNACCVMEAGEWLKKGHKMKCMIAGIEVELPSREEELVRLIEDTRRELNNDLIFLKHATIYNAMSISEKYDLDLQKYVKYHVEQALLKVK